MVHELAMTLIPGIGNVLVKQLISYLGSAEKLFNIPKGKLLKIPGIGEKTADLIMGSHSVLKTAEEQLKIAEKSNTQVLFYTSPNYPQRLRAMHDSPVLLFWRGNSNLNHPRTIGIVGTRTASAYGKMMTEKIIDDCKHHNPLIISGLAYGIDIAAHKAALQYGVETIGVMGNGLQKIYPYVHTKVAEQMQMQGGILSEYMFGVEPAAPHFPHRNRIIAGLSDVLLVVETSNKGGTLITVDIAINYKKPILAVPGMLGTKTSEGCLELIQKKKAFIYTKTADIEEITGWFNQNKPVLAMPEIATDLSKDELLVYELLQAHEELQIDDIAWRTKLPIQQVASILLNLEFQGLVKAFAGKKFKIVK
jgi:DNA processing protein